ncbi:DUF3576 domain-containing protein [Arenibaculum pallidiluteum]|uniref:DUF3576 domain-containing protein n=1 Tax=Arenibaculum pallidiluteum TaxID=2812559 RepID=UPI001A958419|nr:DUF3576 domain-containing protein [Arenibaculum pallidiluteum]
MPSISKPQRPTGLGRFPLVVLAGTALAVLGGCSGIQSTPEYPKDEMERQYEQYGSLLGGEGGFNLFGGPRRRENTDQGSAGIGVNSYLWRASLDTLAFMPVVSADPFGGVILTDWYSPADTPNERFKVNVYILDRQLRADGIRVAVFRQQRAGGTEWRDSAVTPETQRQLEDAILTRARQLRLASAPQS